MESKTIIQYLLIFALIFHLVNAENKKISFKCDLGSKQNIPKKAKEIPLEKLNPKYKRKLDDNRFQDFNIVIELKNIETEIELNNLSQYHDLIINALKKAVETIKSLVKVRPYPCFSFDEDFLDEYGFHYWDKEKFGITDTKKSFDTCELNIDLLIVTRFFNETENLDNLYEFSSDLLYRRTSNDQPIVVSFKLDKFFDFSKRNSKTYLEHTFLHHITHKLGFNLFHIENTFHNMFSKIDSDGVERYYINSTKVVQVAKKYFNCSDIKGVELEEDGDNVTPHWESRILLGEYMNKETYTEEQVISEFTLAFLEDTGYYKVNYYTGGLMRYGKNKGCKFLKEKCVNNYEINPNFENEFFDLYADTDIDASCSSGRQSRTYFAWWYYNRTIPSYYQYLNEDHFGGLAMADYCPVSRSHRKDEENGLYVGRCSNIGFGDYGTKIEYSIEKKNIIIKAEI